MKVLIFGGEGMLGHKVFQVLSESFDTYATFHDIDGLWTQFPMYRGNRHHTIGGVNALAFDTIIDSFKRVEPDVVVNCIGIIKQVKAAADARMSISINSLFPHRLAELCRIFGARLIHPSTDCVFSGLKGKYNEDDLPDAGDSYGRSKLLGEVAGDGCLTLRTSIIGRDFLKNLALLEWFLSRRGSTVKGYVNHIYSGFPTQVLAGIIGDLIVDHPSLSGLYHLASEPISKYDLLRRIRDRFRLDIQIDEARVDPCDRSMSPARFVEATGYRIPTWQEMIEVLATDETPYDDEPFRSWRTSNGAA